MESLKVLFLGSQKVLNPIYNDFLHAIGENHTVHLYDANISTTEQFNNIDVVVASTPELCTRQMIDVAVISGVKLWQVLSTGLDHYDVAYFLERGLPLANTPGIFSSIALAEHALFLMLSLVKNFSVSQKMIKDGKIYEPLNDELYGKTLGLIGFGASGRQLAKLTVPMGMRVVAVDILDIPIEICDEYNVEFLGGVEYLDQLLTMADFVSIHASLTSKSRHMINRKSFELMRPTSFLINVARGDIVEESALLDALNTGQIRGAGLDVFAQEPLDTTHPFLSMENVVVTPHIAGVTSGTSRRRANAAADNIERISQGSRPNYLVTTAE